MSIRIHIDQGVVSAVAVAVQALGVVGVGYNAVRGYEPADVRIIKPGFVIVKARLRVELLVGELVVACGYARMITHGAEGHVFRGLDTADTCFVTHHRRAVQVVLVKVEDAFP